MSKQTDFINLVTPGAQEVQRQRGMFASVTIAQSIQETGWGISTPKDRYTGVESYNLFGRKAHGSDPYVTSLTWEVYDHVPDYAVRYESRVDGKFKVWIWDNFKRFNSYEESILDRSSFLTLPWYQKACSATTPEDAARFLIDTGYPGYSYATDPDYVTNLINIIRDNNLTQYDLKGDEDEMDKVLDYPDWAWAELKTWVDSAYNDKFLDSWDWCNKTNNKQLTYKDLLLLKILIDDRRRTGKTVRE